jgi:hypothetical protein
MLRAQLHVGLMPQLHLCSCAEGDPLRIPLGQHKMFTGALAHTPSSQTLSNARANRFPLAPWQGLTIHEHSSRHYATQLRKPSLRGRGFYYPASLPHNRPGEPSTLHPARRANDALPSQDDSTPRSSSANEPCYVVLPLASILLTACFSLLYVSLLISCFSLRYCITDLASRSLSRLSSGSALYPHTEIRTSQDTAV